MTGKLNCSREADRTRVIMRATVFAADGARQARVRDLSQSGAQLAVDGPLPVNRDVIFKRGSIFAAAKVVWSDERLTGLRFYRDLLPDELGSSIHTGAKD
jgi:hypothetical protein